jgi:hypothetical protein
VKVDLIEETYALMRFDSVEDYHAALRCFHPFSAGTTFRTCTYCGARWWLVRWGKPKWWVHASS